MAATDEDLPNFNIMLAFDLPVSVDESEVPESTNVNSEIKTTTKKSHV